MKLSSNTRMDLYRAICEPIVDVRIKLKLSAKDDIVLAQVEPKIWQRVIEVLKLPNTI